MTWSRTLSALTLSALALVAGCDRGSEPETAADDGAARALVPASGPSAGGTGEEEAGGEERGAEAAMPTVVAPIDRSGIEGTALEERGVGRIAVTLSLEGLAPDSIYSAHLRQGRCGSGGPVIAPLGRIRPDAKGQATARFQVASEAVSPDEPVFIQVHAPGGRPVACADLQRHAARPSLMTGPDTPDVNP